MLHVDLNIILITHLVAEIWTFFDVPKQSKATEFATSFSWQLRIYIPDKRLIPLECGTYIDVIIVTC